MTLEAALRALSDAEIRVHDLEAERTRLALRVKDLEQQLVARKAPPDARPDPSVLSFFQDPTAPDALAPGMNGDASEAVRVPRGRRGAPATTPRPRGRQPLDPALPREVIRLPDPLEAGRVD